MVERKREPLASTVYPKEVEVVKCLCIPTHGRLIKSWLQLDLCYALPFVLSAIVLFAGPLKCASLMPPWPLVAPVCNNRHTTVEAAGTSVCPWERKAIAGVDTHTKKNPLLPRLVLALLLYFVHVWAIHWKSLANLGLIPDLTLCPPPHPLLQKKL